MAERKGGRRERVKISTTSTGRQEEENKREKEGDRELNVFSVTSITSLIIIDR